MTEKRRGRPPKSMEVETPSLPDPSITALEYRALMSDLQTRIAVAVRSGQMGEARRLQAELNAAARAM